MEKEKDHHDRSESPKQRNGCSTVSPAEGIEAKIESVFKNFPNADRVWHDGTEVYLAEIKENLTLVKRQSNNLI
jgi:hypothetical protein